MFHSKSSSGSKLPNWQYTPNTPRRATIGRKTRIFAVLALCLIIYFRYREPTASEGPQSVNVNAHIHRTFPPGRAGQKQVSSAHKAIHLKDEGSAGTKPQPALMETPIGPEPLVGPEPPVVLKSKDTPDTQVDLESSAETEPQVESDSQPAEDGIEASSPDGADKQVKESDAKKEMTEEYEDEPQAREPVLKETKKGDGQGSASEEIDHAPPAAVREKSGKMLEQHLASAGKYQEDTGANYTQDNGSRFPTYSEFAILEEKAEALPDIIHTPLEESTSDVILQGWEDDWYANAVLDVAKWGKIEEPKIDFVYTCKNPALVGYSQF